MAHLLSRIEVAARLCEHGFAQRFYAHLWRDEVSFTAADGKESFYTEAQCRNLLANLEADADPTQSMNTDEYLAWAQSQPSSFRA